MQKNKTWIEISKKALISNIAEIRKILKKNCKLCCVVKANAYGHGIAQVVDIINDYTDLFAVDSLSEAMQIREKGIKKPIIVLGYTPLKDLKVTIDNDISFVCYNKNTLDEVVKINSKKKAKIHIKIETGTNRQGLTSKSAIIFAKKVKKLNKYFDLEGIYTHYANIEDTLDPSFAMLQLKRFSEVKREFDKQIGKLKYYHTSASAGIFLYPQTHFNTVRLGISLYGLWPSKEVQINESTSKNSRIKLLPVLTWKSIVAQVKKIQKGESVSYGRTWFSKRSSTIAIIPVGYFDGIDRKLSNTGRILIKGKYVPIIGRVAMDMIVVDVTDIKNVYVEDEVVILGRQGKNQITAEEISNKLGTINYEVICKINPLIPRYIK
ncbi:alanine racemase [Patescibacteria group bacterium]